MTQPQRNSSQHQRQHAPHQQQQHEQQQQQQQPDLESCNLRNHLTATGEMDRLRVQLQARLVDCGWRDAAIDRAKESIARRGRSRSNDTDNNDNEGSGGGDGGGGGVASVTLEELVTELMVAGREMVPEEVRREALARIIAAGGFRGVDVVEKR